MRTIAILTLAGTALFAAACEQQPAVDTNTAAVENEAVTDAAAPANTSAAALPAAVDAETAKTVMHDRHENFEKLGDAMKVIGRELDAGSPDLARVRTNADTIAALAPQLPSWFPAGTGPDAGKTHAKAIVWEQPADFLAKASDFDRAAQAFKTAAQGTDVAAIRTAQGELGKTCKSCHDTYREKD
ncbi:cytochrome c [Sphingomonas sabuli]|uniref:Cytochrome c n=1 Tax=Sphingomonas sabuli TaxID=2764186 RepID=A0A7G9L552_9SPHN|nr:cytochrome c [Sphingomonas sabuli]QNM83751.1 cytochrome c [Sphingomonas sabuli]